MSNIIPPLLSDTPPPPPDNDEHEDDEFGDFTGTNNLSYDYDDSVSPPGSPLQLPVEQFEFDDPLPSEICDINSNSKENMVADSSQLDRSKDFCDKRKDLVCNKAGSFVASNFCSESVVSKITEQTVDDKLHTTLNVTASTSILKNHNLPEEDQEHTELRNNEKLNEIIETNCDIKTTSCQQEIKSKGCGVFSKTECKLDPEFRGIDNTNTSNDIIATSSSNYNITVNCESNTGANSVHNSLELKLDDVTIDTKLPEQFETISNKTSSNGVKSQMSQTLDKLNISIDDNVETVKHFEDTANTQNMKTDMSESSNDSQLSNTFENSVKIDEFCMSQDEEMCNIERLSETINKIGSQQNCDSSNVCVKEIVPKESALANPETNSKQLSRFSNDEDKFAVFSEESFVNNTCLDNNEFGAFISNSVDVQNCSVENNEFTNFVNSSSDTNYLESSSHATLTGSDLTTNLFRDSTSGALNYRDRANCEIKSDLQVPFEETKGKDLGKTIANIDNDDFGDFATIGAEQIADSSIVNYEEKKFDDFACFPQASQNSNQVELRDEDDFGDFTSTFASQQNLPEQDHYDKILLLSDKQALEKSHKIIKEMFPPLKCSVPDFEYKGLEANDKIFNQIKNITDTHALSFQWSKSASQNLLLMALNIDSRNILYGPSWHASVPRFAANLSLKPLEPVKSEILTPTPVKETNASNPSQCTTTVDALPFDPAELGMTDPLDSIPDKEPNNSANLTSDTTNTVTKESISVTLEPTVTPNDASSLHASKIENPVPILKHDDFDSFVSYANTSVHENSHGHNIVLRETHISNKEPSKTYEQDIVNWLEPTIVTPELSRKERAFVEADDEFDDFQMVVMPEDHSSKSVESSVDLSVKPLEVLQPQLVSNSGNDTMHASVDLNFLEENVQDIRHFKQHSKGDEIKESTLQEVSPVDDDFGDFTFSLPAETKVLQTTHIAQPTSASTSNTSHIPFMNSVHSSTPAPLLEPLKPSVVQLQNVSSISWPAPGITDSEISRFEALGYSRAQQQHELKEKNMAESIVVQKALVEQSTRQRHQRRESSDSLTSPKSDRISKTTKSEHVSKQNSFDDEEWSDFVSVQNSSPIHKLKAEKERSSTPDLPLSVLNLGSIQPEKQPIPVITPNGLVQTKLSSNMTLNFPNMMQQTNRVYSQPQAQNNPIYQPSIISNQFATQAYAGFNSYTSYQPHRTPGPKTSADDDEWSDFVSHQSTLQKSNQSKYSQNWSNQQNQSSSWMNTTPNIITNPAAGFDVLSGSSIQQQTNKKFDSVQNRKGNGIPCVSIPELDFLAPRNRTIQRK